MIRKPYTSALGIYLLYYNYKCHKAGQAQKAISRVSKSVCRVKCMVCLWRWLAARVSILQCSIMQCPHAETLNSMVINAEEQHCLSAPSFVHSDKYWFRTKGTPLNDTYGHHWSLELSICSCVVGSDDKVLVMLTKRL